MRFIELFNDSTKLDRLSNIGSASFGSGVTDKNEERTPHYEIEESLKMYETNSLIASGINQLVLFIIPDEKLRCYSEDEKSKEFMQEWLDYRRGMIEEARNLLKTRIACGNAYLEKHLAKSKDGGMVLDNVFSFNDSSRLYLNPDSDGPEKYIFKLPVGIKSFKYRGKVRTPQYYNVPYIKNYNYSFRRVYGIALDENEIIHWKTGWSRDNLYGRSMLSSSIDDHNIMSEILNSWDTIAKTRQLDRKILTIDDPENAFKVPQSKMDEVAEQLEDSDKSFTLLNFPLKVNSQDITTSSGYDLMTEVFDILRRKLMMSLLPTYLTPWNESGTTQGAEASMPPFLARIKASQNELINFLNNAIMEPLKKKYDLAEDLTFVFDEPKVLPDENYIRKITDLVRDEIITKEAGQKILVKLGIIEEDAIEETEEEPEEPEEPEVDALGNEPEEESYSEAQSTLKGKMSFDSFKQKLRKKNPQLKTTSWKPTAMHQSVGGKEPRVVETEDSWLLFNGITLAQTLDKDIIDKNTMKLVFKNYVKTLEKEREQFLQGETEEDKLVNTLKKDLEKEVKNRLQKIYKLMDTHSTKNESWNEQFLGMNIFPKIDQLFSDFNSSMTKSVNKTVKQLGINVVDDKNDDVDTSDEFKKLVDEKKRLIRDNLKDQIRTTKDKMVTDIKSQLKDGINKGQSVSDIKKNVRKNFDYDKKVDHKFDRIIHTTTRQSSMILKLRKWLNAGFDSYEWLTKEDDKVRPEHRRKNKKVFSIRKSLKSNNMAAFPGKDFNCRCSAVPYA